MVKSERGKVKEGSLLTVHKALKSIRACALCPAALIALIIGIPMLPAPTDMCK